MQTEKEDIFTLQMCKLETKYKDMSTETVCAIRDNVMCCIDSDDMRLYLTEQFRELNSADLIEIITGALKPLAYKLDLMKELAVHFPHQFEEIDSFFDFEPYVQLYQEAVDNMQIGKDETAVFLLNGYRYDKNNDRELFMSRPFFSFDAALMYIKQEDEDWLCGYDKVADALIWFEIEKWVGMEAPELIAAYTVSKYGEVWDFRRNNDLHHSFGISNALGLYLPVPFSAGDVITIDCTPFAPAKHGVIVTIGDNHDCCSVQCLYLKKDGTLDIGGLKHSHVFDTLTPYVSVLYKAEVAKGNLPEYEAYMVEVGQKIAEWEAERKCREDYSVYNDIVEYTLYDLLEGGCTPDALLNKLKNAKLKTIECE